MSLTRVTGQVIEEDLIVRGSLTAGAIVGSHGLLTIPKDLSIDGGLNTVGSVQLSGDLVVTGSIAVEYVVMSGHVHAGDIVEHMGSGIVAFTDEPTMRVGLPVLRETDDTILHAVDSAMVIGFTDASRSTPYRPARTISTSWAVNGMTTTPGTSKTYTPTARYPQVTLVSPTILVAAGVINTDDPDQLFLYPIQDEGILSWTGTETEIAEESSICMTGDIYPDECSMEPLGQSRVLVGWASYHDEEANPYNGRCLVATVSGEPTSLVIGAGSAIEFSEPVAGDNNAHAINLFSLAALDGSCALAFYHHEDSVDSIMVRPLAIDGDVITSGEVCSIGTPDTAISLYAVRVSSTTSMLVYQCLNGATAETYGRMVAYRDGLFTLGESSLIATSDVGEESLSRPQVIDPDHMFVYITDYNTGTSLYRDLLILVRMSMDGITVVDSWGEDRTSSVNRPAYMAAVAPDRIVMNMEGQESYRCMRVVFLERKDISQIAGIALSSADIGETCTVAVGGIVSGFADLEPGRSCIMGGTSALRTFTDRLSHRVYSENASYLIGEAISPTAMYLMLG